MNKFLGITLAILAIAIAVVPSFTDCQSQGIQMTLMNGMKVPMVCHWTAQAEIAVGSPLFVVGAMLPFTRCRSGLFTLSVMGVVLGLFAILLPTTIIGTCASPAEICNTAMKPILTALGSVAIVGSLGGLLLARRSRQ